MFFYMLVYERPYITSTHKSYDFYRDYLTIVEGGTYITVGLSLFFNLNRGSTDESNDCLSVARGRGCKELPAYA